MNQHRKRHFTEAPKESVILCDRQPLFRLGLRLTIEQHRGFKVAGETDKGEELLMLLQKHPTAIVLIDLSLAQADNYRLLRQLRERFPKVRVLLLIPRNIYPLELASAIQAGATGCLFRNSSPALMLKALQAVAAGLPWVQREVTEHLFQALNRLPLSDELLRSLTEKERQVLILLAKGLSNKEIARQMRLSIQTVKTHVSHILQKLRVRSRAEAARYAFFLLRSSTDGQRLPLAQR